MNLVDLARALDLPEVLPVVLQVAVTEKGYLLQNRSKALFVVGRYGSEEDIKAIEPLIQNKSVLWQWEEGGVPMETRLGDVALAAVVHMSGGDLGEYRFRYPSITNPKYVSNPMFGWGFNTDEIRQEAIGKWQSRSSIERAIDRWPPPCAPGRAW